MEFLVFPWLKARLDGAWSNLAEWKVSLPMAGEWNERRFKIPSNANHSGNL